ncbi:MAG TPA: hypothetical protein VJG30_02455 [Candidatus Nanoarchaeia archaeon]|nr:hypothetical protein [Candidatus Nanoarchaeia archaeon]
MLPKTYLKFNPAIFSKGKRGLIYLIKKNNKKYAIKIKLPASRAINRINIEADFLKLLNRYNIGPKIIDFGDDFIVYEFVEGITLKEFLKSNNLDKKIINNIIKQCKILDKLKINKEEMHSPLKNIIITRDRMPVLIDFERCHFTSRPKNLNQFREFLKKKL